MEFFDEKWRIKIKKVIYQEKIPVGVIEQKNLFGGGESDREHKKDTGKLQGSTENNKPRS